MWDRGKLEALGKAGLHHRRHHHLPLLLLLLLYGGLPITLVSADAKPPAIFVFGDSLSDVGNNNYLPYGFKYNFPHNGVDFPGNVPTGRFSNGYNIIDIIAQQMGFQQSPPAYLSLADGKNVLQGANFASGGSGHLVGWCNIKVLDKDLKVCITMEEQVEYFRRISGGLPGKLVSDSIFLFTAGGNDVIYFYLTHLLDPDRAVDDYIINATSIYGGQLKELYRLGARKFALINVPAIGFSPIPTALSAFEANTRDKLNSYSRKYNEALSSMAEGLASSLEGMKYSVGDAYAALMEVINHPAAYGMKNITSACCGGVRLGIEWPPVDLSLCVPEASYCSNRSEYLFWDVIHPTQAACEHAGKMFYGGASPFVTPINFKQLVGGDTSDGNAAIGRSGNEATLEKSLI